jgi:hypothetical protein
LATVNQKALALAILLLLIPFGYSATFDAYLAFETATNPNGNWQYGYEQTIGGALTDFTSSTTGDIEGWKETATSKLGVYANDSGMILEVGTAKVPSHQMFQTPGVGGEYSVIRFTVAATGTYKISVGYFDVDTSGPIKTRVRLLVDGTSAFMQFLNSASTVPVATFTETVKLNVGDTVDSVTGYGSPTIFDANNIAVNFSLQSVPENPTFLVWGIPALVLLRKRSK